MRVRRTVVTGLALLCALGLASVACNGNHAQLPSTTVRQSNTPDGEANWMHSPPTKQLGAYSLYLLDAQKNIVQDPAWLAGFLEKKGAADSIIVSSIAPPPSDIYLYITYPAENRRLLRIELADQLDKEYLLFSVAQRIENVVAVGLARYGSARGTETVLGNIFRLDFIPGTEQTYKTGSLVNVDNNSAPLLEVSGSQPGGTIDLAWDERNIGDYNNNGEVEIADITPIALNFGKTLVGSPIPGEFLVVDGDENGEINLADLTPIARNFMRTIEGYTVYHATGESPGDGDFTPLATPTVTRQQTWGSSDDSARRRRLQYTFHHEVGLGTHSYYVRAFSADGSPGTQGLQSNTVSQIIIADNLPAEWDSVEGISVAVGITNGIKLTFGSARDPEGGEVEYVLRYTEGFDPIGTPGTIELTLPPETTAGVAPYNYTVEPLVVGQRYNFLLRAYDPEGNGTTNTVTTSTTVPMLGVSTDPWAYIRGDLAGTASVAGFEEPDTMEIDWQYGLGLDIGSPDNEPVISKDGWIAVAHNDGTILRLDMVDGSLLSTHPAAPGMGAFRPALDGDTLVVGTATGLAVYDMATVDPPTLIGFGHEINAAPLLMGNYIFAVAQDGWIIATLVESGEVAWSVGPGLGFAFDLSPVSDGMALYAAGSDRTVYKINLQTGEFLDSIILSSPPIGNSLAIDTMRGFVYLGTQDDRLVELSTADLELTRNWPRETEVLGLTAPCLVPHATPPMAVVAYMPDSPLEIPGHIVAYNLESGAELWDIDAAGTLSPIYPMSASANRIYAHSEDYLVSLDFNGVRRQSGSSTAEVSLSSTALAGGKIAFVTSNGLTVLVPGESDLAPVWQGNEGIQSLTVGDGSIMASWTYALDDHSAPAYYTLYISESGPPNFDSPFGSTTLITDIPDAGQFSGGISDNEFLLDGLENGTRYWIGVRAYDAPWDETPNIDQNTNWLAATPPWQREELVNGVDLPAGGIFTLRGMLGGDGLLHLVYTDVGNGHLAHVWGKTGAWQHESANIGGYYASAIDLDWDTSLEIAYADILTSNIATLSRIGADIWDREYITPSITFLNPQVSFQLGAENAFAYTEHISGVFPPTLEGHYYISTTDTGVWQAPVLLEENTYSGRDLDLVLDPADNLGPWVAFQRGWGYAPDFFTPETGQLYYSKSDGVGGFTTELVDAGENNPDSDCGKRVRQVVDASGNIHLAYLDLNASASQSIGQLKYAYNGGTGWEVETVHSFGLDFQTMGLQHTWGEISLALAADGTPVIGFLGRISASREDEIPHVEKAFVWVREAAGQWRGELLTDEEQTFPRDREPCVLLVDGANRLHLFFVTTNLNPDLVPDTLVHLWRPWF